MKYRIRSLLLALALLGTLTLWAGASSSALFPAKHTYQEQFADVNAENWFYSNVKALYELGLTNGQGSPHLFAPEDNLTVAEALTMCARLRSLYEHRDAEAGPSAVKTAESSWFDPYVDYLKGLGIIGEEFQGLYRQEATRAQVAHIMAHALPAELFTPINTEAVAVGYASRGYIRDVGDYTPYREDILELYRWGILSGMDNTGAFHPQENIQRGEVAAMVTRLAREELRVKLDWTDALTSSSQGATLEGLIHSDGTFHPAPSPADSQAIDDNLRYMLSRGERRMVLSYGPSGITEEQVNELVGAFVQGTRFYVEQGYNQVQGSWSAASGSVVLTFSSSLYDERMIDSYREATLEAAIQVYDSLWESGAITASTTEYDKARVYYTWLCQHCVYDHASTDESLSHSGYGAFCQQLAVCDGYTAAYNLLLKLEGIQCSTVSTADHIWTVATLDGKSYHIDPTWGDQTGTIAYRYFAMTEQDAMARF